VTVHYSASQTPGSMTASTSALKRSGSTLGNRRQRSSRTATAAG
jgi:hypothetical protein